MNKETINLLIDRGNSFCKVATAKEGIISPIAIYPQLTPKILQHYFEDPKREFATIYSQVGTPDEEALAYLKEHSIRVVSLSAETSVPLRDIHYDRTKLGSDRLALAVGASYIYPQRACLIIDAGTAITYDLIDENRAYLGGDITAGPRTRSKSLHDSTAKLPDVDFMTAFDNDLFSTSTEEAIANGITRGIIAEMEGYMERAKRICPSLDVIVTGGYGAFFANRIKNKTFVVPNLLMVGLNKILEYNEPY